MNSAHLHRRPRKIRRTGKHTTPSPVQNVADRAGKAAPAMAITGVLIAAPHAHAGHAAVRDTTTIVKQIHTDAVITPLHTDAVITQVQTDAVMTRAQPAERTYTVRRGDSLSSIAEHFYGRTADWSELYQVNKAEVHNPDLIYQGEVLDVPEHLSAAGTTTYTPKHAKSTVLTSATSLSGTLSCGGLEELWEEAGGSHAEAFMAAEIAMAESSGRQFATGTVGERGYWQINPNHGSLSTYDPLGNAKAAVILSDDGSNWSPWTTFTSGAYHGRC